MEIIWICWNLLGKPREITLGEIIFGGFEPFRTTVCCKANLVCSDWEAAWCCWNRASKEKERKLPFHRWESSNFFFVFQATLLQSQLTRSLRSSTSSFQCWRRRRPFVVGGTALLVWNDIIFSISLTCAHSSILLPPPTMRCRRRLAVHCHYGLCTVSDLALQKNSI